MSRTATAVTLALAAPIAAPFAAILAGPAAMAPVFAGCLLAAFAIERPQ